MFRGAACVLTAILSVACGGHARTGPADEEPAPVKSLCEADAQPRALLKGTSAKAAFVSLDVRGSSLVAAFQYFDERGAGEHDDMVHQVDLESGERTLLALARNNPRSIAIGDTSVYWIDETPLSQLMRAPLDGSSPPVQVGSASLATVVVDDHLYYGRDGTLMAQPLGEGLGLVLARGVAPLELVTDGEYVYFTMCSQGLKRIHKLGGEVEHLADGYCPMSLAVVDGFVYFNDIPQASVTFALLSVPASGGQPGLFEDTTLQPTTLAADHDSIYVGAPDGLYRIRRGLGEAERLAGGTPTDIALDEHCVYWGDSSADDVFVMRKPSHD